MTKKDLVESIDWNSDYRIHVPIFGNFRNKYQTITKEIKDRKWVTIDAHQFWEKLWKHAFNAGLEEGEKRARKKFRESMGIYQNDDYDQSKITIE